MMRGIAFAAVGGLILAGCAGGLRSSSPPPRVYLLRVAGDDLRPATEPQATSGVALDAQAPPVGTLQIARPRPYPGLESSRIVLVQQDRRLSHYAGSRWAEDLPEVVELLAVEVFRRDGTWRAVHDSRSPFMPDYVVRLAIRHFEADYSGGDAAPRVRVSLECTLGRRADREVIASFVTESVEPAAANRLGAVVAAFERAANAAIGEAARLAAQAVRTSTAPSPP